jgi:hypothetical protein
MSIIHGDDIDRRYREAIAGRPMQRFGASPASSHLSAIIERRLPGVGVEHMVKGGISSYGKFLNERVAAFGGGANVTQVSPEVRNPLLSLINFYLPYDRKTLNQWIRYYARFDPYVHNCIDLNSQFPISDFHFSGISDPGMLRQFEEMKERCHLLQHAFEVSKEEETLGEAYTFWQWDEDDLTWSDYTIMNPDRLEIVQMDWGSGMNAFYFLDPPEKFKELQRRTDIDVQSMLDAMDPAVREALSAGKKIPLDNFNVMAFVRRESPYDERGTSPVLPALKSLLYKDKLIEAQYAIADQQITPVQLWKIGDPAHDYMPNDVDLAKFRALLEAGRHDPLFTIVSHAAVNLELIGYTGKLLPILPELEWVAKQIMVALYLNEAAIMGNGPSYGAAVVPFKILQGRYQAKRNRLVELYRKRLLQPFAEAREMFTTTQANIKHRVRTRRVPIVPDIEWNFKLDLTDSAQKIQYAIQLHEKGVLPMRTICELLNLDYESVKKAVKEEEGSVFDLAYQASRKKRAEAGGTATGATEAAGGGAPAAGGAVGAGVEATPPGEAGGAEPAGGEAGEGA